MTNEATHEPDFRQATQAKKEPKAAVDGVAGMILAFGELSGTPEQAFRALATDEILKWWKFQAFTIRTIGRPIYEYSARGASPSSWKGGGEVHGNGEFCEIDFPRKLVMTRKCDGHPFLGTRETTITYRFEPSPHGTLVTVRDEGFIGLSEAAYGNAESWEKVLGWLDAYLQSS